MCKNSVSFSQKREEILTRAATWVNLEDTMLNRNEPVTKGWILYDCTSTGCLG